MTSCFDLLTNLLLRRSLESTQYVLIKYTERLVEAGIEPSVCSSVGDSYDALAETIRERLRHVLVVQTRVDLVPWGSLERSEYKSKLVDH